MQIDPPSVPRIFIVGSERSGSNLLRTLLGNHSQLEAPVAPHYFDTWRGPLLRSYGDLRKPENAVFLAGDMLEYANHPFTNWALELDVAPAVAARSTTDLYAVFDLLYLAKAAKHGKGGYVCKGNHLFNYAFQVRTAWPNAKFLYLYRDPRDHCASWKKNPIDLFTVWDSIRKWGHEQRLCLDLMKSHGIAMHVMRYEDLIADTPGEMAKALAHCGLPVEEACFQTAGGKHADEAKRMAQWKNLDKPIIKDNARKYAEQLTKDEIRLIETKAGDLMDELGYSCDTDRKWTPPAAHGLRLRVARWHARREAFHRLKAEWDLLNSKIALRGRIRARVKKRNLR